MKRCIDDCKKDEIYKYEFNNICYQEFPEDSIQEYFNNYYDSKNIVENTINNDVNKNLNISKDQRDEEIAIFREMVSSVNISEKKDIIKTDKDVIYQMTTTENQKNCTNKNTSTIDLGKCEERLKKIYNIDQSLPLIIFKIDYFSPDTSIPLVGYEIYHP